MRKSGVYKIQIKIKKRVDILIKPKGKYMVHTKDGDILTAHDEKELEKINTNKIKLIFAKIPFGDGRYYKVKNISEFKKIVKTI